MTPTCTDEDIRRYYKRQAVLVHPDKNRQPGAEEAFKVLAHAFELIGEPVRIAIENFFVFILKMGEFTAPN